MIWVDSRLGSRDLVKPLQKLGLPVEETVLDFGDIYFSGRGAVGSTVTVGIEYKKLGELITSIRDGRFAGHQLPGMQRYDYRYLLYEGDWKEDEETGLIVAYDYGRRLWRPLPGKMLASEFRKHLLTYRHLGGFDVECTRSRAATCALVRDAYRWFNDRALDQHTSLEVVHRPAAFGHVSDFRKTVVTFPGIGIKLSRVVETHFSGKLVYAFTASIQDWAEIEGIGKGKAETVWRYLHG